MRIHYWLVMALWLGFPAAMLACANQEPTGAAQATPAQTAPTGQGSPETGVAPSPTVGPETVPADTKTGENTPGAEKTPAAGAGKKHVPSPSGARKRRKHTPRDAPGTPRKTVVREGGASEPAAQIAPGVSPAEAVHQRQNAERWLGATDEQLKQLAPRTLDARQQETVAQIHNYINGARSALKEGDVGRASTLAQKAHLLSDDLIKH